VAGLAVAIEPGYAAYIVTPWSGGIIINPLSYSGYHDIALRDFGLLLAALTLARLPSVYGPPWFGKQSALSLPPDRDRGSQSRRPPV
jgi:hypothetical protein